MLRRARAAASRIEEGNTQEEEEEEEEDGEKGEQGEVSRDAVDRAPCSCTLVVHMFMGA